MSSAFRKFKSNAVSQNILSHITCMRKFEGTWQEVSYVFYKLTESNAVYLEVICLIVCPEIKIEYESGSDRKKHREGFSLSEECLEELMG